MSATFDTANDEILALFKAAWDTTGLLALYENVAGATPTAQQAWARITIRHSPAGPGTLSGGDGKARYQRDGFLTVQIFIPNGQGLSQGHTLGKVVADAFEGEATDSHVWFRNFRLQEIGPSTEWYQLNAIVDFTYDEIK